MAARNTFKLRSKVVLITSFLTMYTTTLIKIKRGKMNPIIIANFIKANEGIANF
jgi:hypothetical protein